MVPLLMFLNCSFFNNSAASYGGAILTHVYYPYFDNLTKYHGNIAGLEGNDLASYPFKLYLTDDSTLKVTNLNTDLYTHNLTEGQSYEFVMQGLDSGIYEIHNFRSGDTL